MHRSITIVPRGRGPVPSPRAGARPPAASHWRHWRNGGAALSALLHAIVLAALTASVPVFGGQAEREPGIRVEIVERPPVAKLPEKKREPPEAKAIPPAPQPEPAPPSAAKPAPAAPRPQAKIAPITPAPAQPVAPAPPAPAPPAPPAWSGPAPRLPSDPPALVEPAPPTEQQGGLKVEADEAVPPGDRKSLGYWVLEPVVVNLRHACGLARISGVLELKERIAEGRFRGTMRTRIGWAGCPPEGVLHQVELRIRGGDVEMVGATFVDRGAIRGDTMMLEDAFGRTVWKKR